METSEVVDSFDRKVMFGYSEYDDKDGEKEGFILFRFEEYNGVFYLEQKIHIDNKMRETIKEWIK